METINLLLKIAAAEGGLSQKDAWGNYFHINVRDALNKNPTLFPGRYGTTLNATCSNCRNPGHLVYNCSKAGRTDTCYIQVIHSFAQNQIQQN